MTKGKATYIKYPWCIYELDDALGIFKDSPLFIKARRLENGIYEKKFINQHGKWQIKKLSPFESRHYRILKIVSRRLK